ncbi:GNAT family N-acetyltransferase [Diaminobutyricimonas sp. TR449]|uniref:GNAT family N-acetyltransferase n=1 Tax=Diaminobutyricimonas sp. TR449 TaxID=2708076 RepID=UPI001FBA7A49|nr:GNAT family N-acetyltransferase [Diaminobutyricimonas sp. TR449]
MPEIREVSYEHADSTMLRAAQKAELAARYGTPDTGPGVAPSGTDMTAFFVAYEDGMPAGCGGLRQLTDDEAEIKRMYVTPAHRGTGISVAVLEAIEAYSRESGLSKLVLETGTLQPDAMRFYEREGYTRIPNFGAYIGSELSVCYAKSL